mmetsp:Transcript_59435/g.186289  ORF Transcript_59435/g.186289 Transcript_59435/m.186289 type:complete len:819 (+) Transcript_59435:45-2501(+)
MDPRLDPSIIKHEHLRRTVRDEVCYAVKDHVAVSHDVLRQMVRDEVSAAGKDGDVTGGNVLRRMVREEVHQAVDDKEVVEGVLSRSLADDKWMGKIEAAVLQFLKKDFNKVLALGADSYHFRRWDELQAEIRELRRAVGKEPQHDEVSHTRQMVGDVRESHDKLVTEVTSLRERLQFATERLEVMEGQSKTSHDALDRQKAFHFKVLEEQSNELKEEVKKETAKFAEGFTRDIQRLEQEIQGLHNDRTWLHRQEEALSSRCRDIEKRVDESSALTQESNATAQAAVQEAKGQAEKGLAQLHERVDQSHANLQKLYEDLREQVAHEAIRTRSFGETAGKVSEVEKEQLRKEMRDHVNGFQVMMTDSHVHEKKQRETLREDLKDEQRRIHEALERRLHETLRQKTSAIAEEVDKKNSENKVLHEKLQVAVIRGYEAVEAQFREVLSQQIAALRNDFNACLREAQVEQARNIQTQESQRSDSARAAAEQEQRQQQAIEERLSVLKALEQRLSALQAAQESVDGRLRQAMQALEQRLSALQAAQESGDGRVRQELQAEVQAIRAEIDASNQGGQKAVASVDQQLREQLRGACEALERRHSDVAQRLDRLDAEKERAEQRHEQRHRELRSALEEGGQATEKRLNESLSSSLNKQQSHEAASNEQCRAISTECSHKVHAVAYSLLEVIGEVQLVGQPAEAQAKRNKLHNRLCDRLGSSLTQMQEEALGDAAAASQARGLSGNQSSRHNAHHPTFGADGETTISAMAADGHGLQQFGDGSVYLPPVHRPSQPPTPKPSRSPRFGDSLREIRGLRLGDYQTADWNS